jgi:CheY-like chemotaxis protein
MTTATELKLAADSDTGSRFIPPGVAETSNAILLAEDDPVTRMLMTRFLKKAGYEVSAVGDGNEALALMSERYYPILVTDWEMPGMDGIDLCKAVRNLKLDGYVYALLLTARQAKEHIIAGLEAGADDYLIKPVHEPELIARCAPRTSATGFCRSRMRSPAPSTGATSWTSCRGSSSAAAATAPRCR